MIRKALDEATPIKLSGAFRENRFSADPEPYEIARILTVSTGHATFEEMNNEEDMSPLGTAMYKNEFANMFWVSDEEDHPLADVEMSDGMRAAIKLARDTNCEFLRFDQAGPHVDGLPVYDW